MLGQHRSVQRDVPRVADDAAALRESIIALARQYGRYGYRRITALLRAEGWRCNHKRVERIWRAEGLKVPARQPKRGRLWLNDGSCVRLRPERPDHVWAYDFVEDRTRDGRRFRMLNVVDEFTRECLAIRVGRQLRAADVIDVLSDLFILRGTPGHVRSDNGPEFAATAVKGWISGVGATTAFIEPGSPWENGYVESFSVIDSFIGSTGNDIFRTGTANTSIAGGGGMDVLDYSNQAGIVTRIQATWTGIGSGTVTKFLVSGATATDSFSGISRIVGTTGADKLIGSAGDEIFFPLGGNDTIIGGGGTDRLSYASYYGRATGSQGVKVDLTAQTATDSSAMSRR